MQLRPYQDRLVKEICSALVFGRNPLAVAPTGAGKMVMLAALAKEMRSPLLIVEHRKELVTQAVEKLRDIGEDPGVIAASFSNPFKEEGWTPNPYADIRVGMVQTLARREFTDWTPSLLVVDECHLSQSNSYLKLRNRWPDAKRVGLTATPERLDGKGFTPFFDALLHGPTIPELVALKHLSPVEMYSAEVPDLSDVQVGIDGDYDTHQMAVRLNTVKLVGDIVQNWLHYAKDRTTVVFATSVKHSQHVRDAFLSVGVKAEHLDGGTSDSERERILKDLRGGKTTVVCNCGILIEGVDVPNIGCVVQAFGTKSVAKYLQSIGRGSRVHKGKINCIVLDHGGNFDKHGAPDAIRLWTLEGRTPRVVVSRKEDAPEGAFDWISPIKTPAPAGPAQAGNSRPIPLSAEGQLAPVQQGWMPAPAAPRRPASFQQAALEDWHRRSQPAAASQPARTGHNAPQRPASQGYAPAPHGVPAAMPHAAAPAAPVLSATGGLQPGRRNAPHSHRDVPPVRPCPAWAKTISFVWDDAERERVAQGYSLAWSTIKCRMWLTGNRM